MKIMLVSPYFLPKVGGLENYAFNLAKELEQCGNDVFVVTSNHTEKKYSEDTYENIRVIRLPTTINLSNTPINPLWYFNLRKVIKREKPDIINTHSPVPFIADMAILAANKVPTIFTYHAGSMKKSSGPIDTVLGIYENVFLPMLLRKSNAIATVYPQFIQQRVSSKQSGKVFYAPPCIDPSIFYPLKNADEKDESTLLFVGRIERSSAWKGLDVLLEAMRELSDLSHLKLQIVGSGDAVTDFEALATELGIADRIEFSGQLRGEELANAYRKATLLIVPSKSDAEAFGTVTIEAMACGTPVVASRIGGLTNVISKTGGGVNVEPNDSHSLAEAIRTLIRDPAKRALLAKTGRDTVHKDFVWESTARSYIDHMSRLLRAHEPSVIHVTPYFPPHLGGMENVAQSLAANLVAKGRKVKVITSDIGYTSSYKEVDQLKGKVIRVKSTEIAHLPIMWNLLIRLLRTPSRSIFHVHIAQAFVPEVTWLVARLGKSSFIAHFHLDVAGSKSPFSFVFTIYKRTLFPLMLRHADKVVVFSEIQQQLIIQKYHVSPGKIAIIPNGVTLLADSKPRVYINPAKQLLYVGRLSSQKRVDYLIKALSLMPLDISLDIVGSGELNDSLQKLAKTVAPSHTIRFHGALFGDQLEKMYRNAEVFVLASEREGMPLAVLEAMAHGLPIVASDVVGIHELVIGSGVLVANTTPENFADTLEQTLAAHTLQRLSKQSIQRAEHFSWDSIVQEFLIIYKEVQKI